MSSSSHRMPLIDALKAIASQVILLHHLSAYGPLSEAAREVLPALSAWLFDYGRIAVQVFLVIAGFLAARGLSPNGEALTTAPWPMIRKRYLRLAIPYLAAIGLAIICAAIADHWLDDEMIPARATVGQWLAHATLLHGVLGVDSLSAGVWYIAIDFQLFALFALLLWVGQRPRLAPALVLALGLASLFWLNRHPDLDNWAPYFFASYGLGAAAWWASDRRRLTLWLGVIAAVTIAALLVDFRLRIAVALCVALVLAFSRRSGLLERWPDTPTLGFLGQISYSVFLVHFSVLLIANAALQDYLEISPTLTFGLLLATWALCLVAGTLFYRWIEDPAATRRIISALAQVFGYLTRLPVISPLVSALKTLRG